MKIRAAHVAVTIVVFVFLFYLFGIVPLLTEHHEPPFEEMINLVQRLEQEHSELQKQIATLEGQKKIESSASENIGFPNLAELPVKTMSTVPPEHIPTKQFPPPITFSSTNHVTPATLVVGGTDGSGTRRVVQILTQLGVLMVSEDPETYDIHGDLMGGWPPVVKPVLQHARSLEYNPDQFPQQLKGNVMHALRRLLDQADGDSRKPTSKVLAVGGALPRPKDAHASAVKFGFKAPVAMTLSPLWAALLPSFKLLHVLRDGRDIAFSDNQGPVEKFYGDMYHENERPPPQVKAIRLWSDWNTQLYAWAKKRAQVDSGVTGQSFSYFALHSEDLVSDSISVRFAAISSLAQWVGSDLNDDRLCCLSVLDAEFMGSHDRGARNVVKSEKQLSSRYGKWHSRVRGNHALNASLHGSGASGLKLFGYEPMRELAVDGAQSAAGYVCRKTEEECGGSEEGNSHADAVDPKKWSGVTDVCRIVVGKDYKGDGTSDIEAIPVDTNNPVEDCCGRCKSTSGCRFFTVDVSLGYCYMKRSQGRPTTGPRAAGLVSGDLI